MQNFKSGTYINQGYYRSFSPSLINRNWKIDDMEVITLLSKADRMLGRLDMYSEHIPNIELFIAMHIMKEATQSSKIEGTQTRMEDALMNEEDVPLDKRDDWAEVHNYINAMNEAVAQLNQLPFSSRLIRSVHKTLMQGVRGEHKCPGEYRISQNWIGGSTISDAVFVPPVHTEIPELIGDIENFVHNERYCIPDLIKIALIHYQFETIHPFLDGNGRTGRLLITLYLVSKGLLKRPILYLSDYLERHRNTYYRTIMEARTENNIVSWIKFFLRGVILTAENGVSTFSEILAVEKKNETLAHQLGLRSSKAMKVLHELYKSPLIDANKVAKIAEISIPSAYKLIDEMQRIGLLVEVTGGKRGKVFLLQNYFQIFNKQVTYDK